MAGIWCKSESGIHLVGLREKYLGVRAKQALTIQSLKTSVDTKLIDWMLRQLLEDSIHCLSKPPTELMGLWSVSPAPTQLLGWCLLTADLPPGALRQH